MNSLCACDSSLSYTDCCRRFHSRQMKPDSAEQLMRSRYSAFSMGSQGVAGMCEYLLDTHYPSQRSANELAELQQAFSQDQWIKLKILHCEHGTATDTDGTVEFVAFFRNRHVPDQVHQLHESSNFIREEGQWFYFSGKILPNINIKRNEPCWCGSTKKYKLCHGQG